MWPFKPKYKEAELKYNLVISIDKIDWNEIYSFCVSKPDIKESQLKNFGKIATELADYVGIFTVTKDDLLIRCYNPKVQTKKANLYIAESGNLVKLIGGKGAMHAHLEDGGIIDYTKNKIITDVSELERLHESAVNDDRFEYEKII